MSANLFLDTNFIGTNKGEPARSPAWGAILTGGEFRNYGQWR
jgi:hypothetical protein